LTDALVVSEEEQLVLLDGTANAGAELIFAERSHVRYGVAGSDEAFEKIARVQFAIAEEIVDGAVNRIGTGFRGGVNHRAIAAEFCSIGIGERLEFRDGLDAQRRSRDPGTRPALPPILQIFPIQQNGRAFGS